MHWPYTSNPVSSNIRDIYSIWRRLMYTFGVVGYNSFLCNITMHELFYLRTTRREKRATWSNTTQCRFIRSYLMHWHYTTCSYTQHKHLSPYLLNYKHLSCKWWARHSAKHSWLEGTSTGQSNIPSYRRYRNKTWTIIRMLDSTSQGSTWAILECAGEQRYSADRASKSNNDHSQTGQRHCNEY